MPGERFKIGPAELPLTRAQAIILGAVAVVIGMAFAAKQIAELPWFADRGAVKLSTREAAELREAGRHVVEDPDIALTIYDDARGRSTLRHFKDGCYVLVQASADPSTPARLAWILAPDVTESGEAPAYVSTDLTFSTPAYAGEGPRCVERGCLNPHPGRFEERVEALDECWLRVFRRWPDGCEHYAHYDRCNGSWTAPCWVRCRH